MTTTAIAAMPKHRPTESATWQPIAEGVWSLTHHFRNMGMPVSTRMSVMRLADGSLLAHSAVPLSEAQRQQLDSLGPLRTIVAPNAVHHFFIGDVLKHYPDCSIYGPASLRDKRPDLTQLQPLPERASSRDPWAPDVSHVNMGGIPALDESEWFHHPSGTLFMSDICQCWTGPLAAPLRLYLGLIGGRDHLTVPRTARLLTKDKAAAQQGAQAVLAWPIQRIVLLHNSVLTQTPQAALQEAFKVFD